MALLPTPGALPIRACLLSDKLASGAVVMKMASLKPPILHFSTSACENAGASSKATMSNGRMIMACVGRGATMKVA